MIAKDLLFSKMESLFVQSRNPKMAICGVKVGKIKLFWKHWTKPDHKHLTWSCSKNIWYGVSSYKLQKEHRGDGFIPKDKVFCWEIRPCLRFYTKGSHISIASN